MFSYNGNTSVQILEIAPIVGTMVNYLHPVLLGYLGGFLHSKGLIG